MIHRATVWLPTLLVVLSACASCDRESHKTVASSSGDAGQPQGGSGGAGGAAVRADCSGGWCRIPAGTFTIGSPADEWGHPPLAETQQQVTLTRSFLITQTEVTQAMWTKHRIVNPSMELPNSEGDCLEPECPVGHVTWFEAARFANEVSQHQGYAPCYELSGCTGRLGKGMTCTGVSLSAPTVYDCPGFRLPTEAEWEYAARAGTTTPVYSGEMAQHPDISGCYPEPNLDSIAWYCANENKRTHPVAQLMPNVLGLHDLLGNAYELVHSVYTPEGYGDVPLTDPGGEAGPSLATTRRVRRGGAYYAWNTICRAAHRGSSAIGIATVGNGFRLARTLGD
jgi:formylglycine-generating enzyme required for sulfatase activity